MSFWPSIRDLSRIRLDPNLLQNQFVLTRCSKLGCNGVCGDWRTVIPQTLFQAFHNLWISYWDIEATTHMPLDCQTKTKETDFLTFQMKCPKSICGSLFLFACGERVRNGSGVVWSQRYLPAAMCHMCHHG